MDGNASWRNLLMRKYGDFSSIFFDGAMVNEGSKSSLWWRDILSLGANLFSAGWLQSCIRCGLWDKNFIDFWHPHKIRHLPLNWVFTNLFAGCGAQCVKVADTRVWHQDMWHWQILWMNLTDQPCIEEADTLSMTLLDLTPVQNKEDRWRSPRLFLFILVTTI